MSDTIMQVLKLIDEGYSLNELSLKMGISRDQIYNIFRKLRTKGMEFNKKYYDDGEIVYELRKELIIPPKNDFVNLITRPDCDTIKFLLVSDLHAGNMYERMDAWDAVYDYCIEHGIHNIIISGDLVDGVTVGWKETKTISDPIEQLEHFTKNYPVVDDITNFVTFGNHDIDLLTSCGVNIETYLQNYRHDIVPVGFGYGIINIKNDKILVTHPLCIDVSKNIDLSSNFLLIKGHQHRMRSIIGTNGSCSLNVPSLSDMYLYEDKFLPGAMSLSIEFKNGYFNLVYYEQLVFNNGHLFNINSSQIAMTPPRDRGVDEVIRNVENRAKKKILKPDNS